VYTTYLLLLGYHLLNLSEKYLYVEGLQGIAISDHYPVCITRKINQRYYPNLTHKTIKYRCFKNFKEDLFLADLQHINISQINLINDIQAATDMWYTLFMRIINKHAPLKTKE
jgi:hypothetical protein